MREPGGRKLAKKSAGLLIYRFTDRGIEVFLVHPGGPFWEKKDEGAWSIPKGEYEADEDPFQAARREFKEETGFDAPSGTVYRLEPVRQPSGKLISAWAVKGDFDALAVVSNSFTMEWPPKSGKVHEFPEVDRARWFDLETAKTKIIRGQLGFVIELENTLS
ncbi:MAG TPA: NUDIX domain-containing protein [Syntrophorhabdaceae bacterium]|nr:NUDIX domain-containing protein [Syntrophorhabdaceae bacterium]